MDWKVDRMKCKECKYCEQWGAGYVCRRMPPVVIAGDEFGMVPTVVPEDDWCGEFDDGRKFPSKVWNEYDMNRGD